ncbi:MAG: hypothetical protein ACRDRL_04090 [Sciscionella sp.]
MRFAPLPGLEVVMRTLFRRSGRRGGVSAVAALTVGLVAVVLAFTAPARAQSSPCSDSLTTAPTGPATVSAASTAYGKVLVVGSGAYTGCSLYLLTSDQLHALSGADYACSNGASSSRTRPGRAG